MGCISSKATTTGSGNGVVDNKREADRWQRRKKTGFRDSGLERTREACVQQKKKLRHVEDPQVAKKKRTNVGGGKTATTTTTAAPTSNRTGKNKTNATNTGGGENLGLTASFLQRKRAGLKKGR